MSKNNLQVFNLTTFEDFNSYKNHLAEIDFSNPFFRTELIYNVHPHLGFLKYFIFSVDNTPSILMIVNIRQIIIGSEKTPYFDVISPYSYSGPLMTELTNTETIKAFWKAVDNWYRNNNIVTEFIRFSLNNNHLLYSGKIIPTLNNVKGQILTEELQWENFKSKVRNNFRKAVENNLEFKMAHRKINKEVVLDFYNIYTKTMVRKTAENHFFYSFEYFYNFIVNNPESCAIAIVHKNHVPISTELLLLSGDTVFSFLGGTNENFFNTRPNDFLKINVLNWARKMGYKFYNLGGGRINGDGLYNYKKSFFPKDDDNVYFTGRKILDRDIYMELVKKVQKKDEFSSIDDNDISIDFFPKYRCTVDTAKYNTNLQAE